MAKEAQKENTKKLIQETFIELVEERGYSKVTVKDITSKAQVNRNTFYLHYLDKEDLINEIMLHVLNTQKIEFEKLSISFSNNTVEQLEKIIVNILSIIYKEIEFYRIIINDPSLSGLFNRLQDTIKFDIISGQKLTQEQLVFYDYFTCGVLGVFSKWIYLDSYPIETIAKTLSKLIYTDYNLIFKK